MQRLSTSSHRRQWGDLTLRMLVTPGSVFLPAMAKVGDGMPQRAIANCHRNSRALHANPEGGGSELEALRHDRESHGRDLTVYPLLFIRRGYIERLRAIH